jgi:hypothetical protein
VPGRRRALIGGSVLLAGVLVLAIGLFASAGILAVGIGAAVWPARPAAKLDVLRAIYTV